MPQRIGVPELVPDAIAFERGGVAKRIGDRRDLRAFDAAAETARGVGPGTNVGERPRVAIRIGLGELPVHVVIGKDARMTVRTGTGYDIAGPVADIGRLVAGELGRIGR